MLVLAVCLLAVGCGKKSDKKEEKDVKSVSEEIARGVSEDAVPAEALVYTSVSFNLPEGYAPDKDNTENLAYYFNDSIDDLSYIAYSKANKPVDYHEMTQGDYADAFLAQYNVNINFLQFEKLEKEDYYRIMMMYEYSFGNIDYCTTEYIYVTEDNLFTVCFCWDKRSSRENEFNKCADTIVLCSVVNTINDSKTPGKNVTDEYGIISDNEVKDSTIVEDKGNYINSIGAGAGADY